MDPTLAGNGITAKAGDSVTSTIRRKPTAAELERLSSLGLHFNQPEPAIICTRCRFALKADQDRVSRHLGEKHGLAKMARSGLNKLVQSLHLPDPAVLPRRRDGSAQHPYLEVQSGAECKHCQFRSTSIDVLSRHLKQKHLQAITRGTKGHWLRDQIHNGLVFQSWLSGDIHNSWRALNNSKGASLNTALEPARTATEAVSRHVMQLQEQELQHLFSSPTQERSNPTPAVLTTNWMRRTGWEELFKNAQKGIILSLCQLPSSTRGTIRLGECNGTLLESGEADEERLAGIVHALDRLLDRCGDTVRHTDVSIRRWLRGRFPEYPYKAPFELVASATADRQYRRLLKRCVCFWMRFHRLSRCLASCVSGRRLTKTQRQAIQLLWNDTSWTALASNQGDPAASKQGSRNKGVAADVAAENGDDDSFETDYSDDETAVCDEHDGDGGAPCAESSDDASSESDMDEQCFDEQPVQDAQVDTLLRFCYFMATEEYDDGQSSSSLLVYFSGLCGLSLPDGAEFLRPAKYTTHLSGLIYCVRLVMLEGTLPRFPHTHIGMAARPRRGQLAVLQPVRREKMCDGSASPLGEFLSLLALGTVLRQSEGPTCLFEWSDNGEEIAWDGEFRLAMSAFKGLVHTVLKRAEETSAQLMWNWKTPSRDFKTIHDRLSNSSTGYSFVTEPRNELAGAYLELFKAACLSTRDSLLKSDADRKEVTWDVKAASRYLEDHDAHLKALMVLCHLDGGQCSRITELQTIEHVNTAARFRGIGFYAGYMFTAIRHNKTRLTTNNEFYVAHFLSPPVAELLFEYLVYIRRLAYMLRRSCFRLHEEKSLLFAPAATPSAWSSTTFSKELAHFSKQTPGIGFDIGAKLYRQLSIAITEKHIRPSIGHFNRFDDTSARGKANAALAWQSGHSLRQRYSTYGLDGAYPDKLQPALLNLYLDASKEWHLFLYASTHPNCNSQDRAIEASATGESCPSITKGSRKRRIEAISTDSASVEQWPARYTQSAHDTPDDSLQTEDADATLPREATSPSGSTQGGLASEASSAAGVITSSAPQSPFHPFVHLESLKIVICRFCRFAVCPSEIVRHLSCGVHKGAYKMHERKRIQDLVWGIPGIIQTQEQLRNFTYPSRETARIPYIAPPRTDGLRCNACPYVSRQVPRIQGHCKRVHGWKNDWVRTDNFSKKSQEGRRVPWTTNISCQRLFPSRAASGWFEVRPSD